MRNRPQQPMPRFVRSIGSVPTFWCTHCSMHRNENITMGKHRDRWSFGEGLFWCGYCVRNWEHDEAYRQIAATKPTTSANTNTDEFGTGKVIAFGRLAPRHPPPVVQSTPQTPTARQTAWWERNRKPSGPPPEIDLVL